MLKIAELEGWWKTSIFAACRKIADEQTYVANRVLFSLIVIPGFGTFIAGVARQYRKFRTSTFSLDRERDCPTETTVPKCRELRQNDPMEWEPATVEAVKKIIKGEGFTRHQPSHPAAPVNRRE
jgi:hypothetical protein